MLSSPIQLPSLSIKEKRTSSVINASLLRVIRFNQNASFPIPILAGFEFSIFWPYRSSIHEYANGRNDVRKKKRRGRPCTRCWYRDWYRTTTAEKEKSVSRSTIFGNVGDASSFHSSLSLYSAGCGLVHWESYTYSRPRRFLALRDVFALGDEKEDIWLMDFKCTQRPDDRETIPLFGSFFYDEFSCPDDSRRHSH